MTGLRLRTWTSRASLAAAPALAALLVAHRALAAVAEPAPRPNEAFDVMNLLAHHGLHDLDDESWNAYGQMTDIYSLKLAMPAKYSGRNSLSTGQELSFTETATLYVGLRLWPGAEAYFVPEVIGEKPLSHLTGLGGVIQNFELQKGAPTPVPVPYVSRTYIQQSFGFGGEQARKSSDPSQIAHVEDSRRLVLTLGNFSVLDFFDKNDVAGDLRRSFFNMAFLSYAAYDFAADARGYAWGGIAQLDLDDWAIRFGRLTPPKDPNQLALEFNLGQHYGDQLEIEHRHKLLGRDGAVRVLGYRNVENMGRFDDAVSAFRSDPTKSAAACKGFSYGSPDASAPDLCWARRDNVKMGIGLSVEQRISDDLGVFFRGMYSDGQTEVYSYTSTDRSISFGGVLDGTVWHRKVDSVGLGWGQGWISKAHAQYLALGGIDGFIGDGKLRQASEGVMEVFYRAAIGSSSWVTVDYQHIWNPAYNADRGAVDIFGGRIHVEF